MGQMLIKLIKKQTPVLFALKNNKKKIAELFIINLLIFILTFKY